VERAGTQGGKGRHTGWKGQAHRVERAATHGGKGGHTGPPLLN